MSMWRHALSWHVEEDLTRLFRMDHTGRRKKEEMSAIQQLEPLIPVEMRVLIVL